ncbi:MAG TPA: prephenate dehydrogenase/arogenate dehydrogenase family protein [Ruminiclostridium sp.]|nr:prephenate dehydrogenase/arogenate dehydrogenase family protein [Ruminiclostridium sp.]
MVSEKNIGIIGLGLIGGSVARALKRCGKGYTIYAYDRDEQTLHEALAEKIIDHMILSLKEDLSKCGLIFLCIPVNIMEATLAELMPGLSPQCILTDAGSTKGEVAEFIEKIGLEDRFIGGHPLAGSEKSGFSASKANLFENAFYCLAPTLKTPQGAMDYLKDVIKDMGAIPLEMSPEEHDRAVAVISHVPHIVAALLVNLTGSLDNPQNTMKTIAAGGFKDITRIASSSPELWTGICFSNRDEILGALSELEKALTRFKKALKCGDLKEVQHFFSAAGRLRSTFSDRKSLIQKTFDILVDVDDRPGIIAVISSALAKENINIKNIGILNNREHEEGALEIQFEDEGSRFHGITTLSRLGYSVKKKE